MRHFFAARAVPGLAGGMAEPAGALPLIAPAGVLERRAPGALSTRVRAVPLPAITPAAQVEELATLWSGADDQP